jgi:putative flippase GtrA
MEPSADHDAPGVPRVASDDFPVPGALPPYRERVYDATATATPSPGRVAGLTDRLGSLLLSRALRRFAVVGLVNTAIDVALFALLHAPLGIVAANFVSTSAGMTFSFLVNGRFSFGARRVTLRHAVLFVVTNGSTMWVLQPLLITLAHDALAIPLMIAKVGALSVSVVANFLLYRYVVWPERAADSAGGGASVSARESSKPTAELARP